MKRHLGTLASTFVAVAAVCAFAQKNPAPKAPHPAVQKSATVKIWGIVRDRATTRALAGVQIGISGSGCGTGSVTTDQSGAYTMNCTTNNTGSQQQGVTLTPWADGSRLFTENGLHESGERCQEGFQQLSGRAGTAIGQEIDRKPQTR